MSTKVKYRTTIVRVVSGAAIFCVFAGCTGHLVYRPKKEMKQVAPIVTGTEYHLPPMPDTKDNDATLAGIDTTGIGVRDDVHIWIYTNYTTTAKRTTLITMAKTLQRVLTNTPKTADDARSLEQSYNKASIMLKSIHGLKPEEAESMDMHLYSHIFNTQERLKVYLHYSLLLAGGKK